MCVMPRTLVVVRLPACAPTVRLFPLTISKRVFPSSSLMRKNPFVMLPPVSVTSPFDMSTHIAPSDVTVRW